jgi:hypothetical protein
MGDLFRMKAQQQTRQLNLRQIYREMGRADWDNEFSDTPYYYTMQSTGLQRIIKKL